MECNTKGVVTNLVCQMYMFTLHTHKKWSQSFMIIAVPNSNKNIDKGTFYSPISLLSNCYSNYL